MRDLNESRYGVESESGWDVLGFWLESVHFWSDQLEFDKVCCRLGDAVKDVKSLKGANENVDVLLFG